MNDKAADLKFDQPHSARIYDYFLDGKSHYEADRQAAAQIEQAIPDVRQLAATNRSFMGRAIEHLARQGVRQFLDIGTGIPTEPNLHQVAQEVAPSARAVYVDNDPLVLVHAEALMIGTPEGRLRYVQADLTEPETIRTSPEFTETIDMDAPVAVSLIAIGHFVPGERLYEVVESLVAPLVSGSYLVMTHLTADISPERVASTVAAYTGSGIAIQPRSKSDVGRFFSGLELVEPGIVPIHRWRPPIEPPRSWDAATPGYAAIGRKP